MANMNSLIEANQSIIKKKKKTKKKSNKMVLFKVLCALAGLYFSDAGIFESDFFKLKK